MSLLRRLERASLLAAAVLLLLGLATSVGWGLFPPGPPAVSWLLHPLLLVLGAVAGVLASRRQQQIEEERWAVLADPHLTKGEVEYAHKNAESQRRFAGTAFLAFPLFLAYWLTYQFAAPTIFSPSGFLLVSPLVGFVAGLVVTNLRRKETGPGA